MKGKQRGAGSFGARPCRTIRRRLFAFGVAGLPPSWRRSWIIARIRATPTWADFREIKKVYAEALRLTIATGVQHHVDHELPLQHPLVSGLHVPGNLRVLTEKQNLEKRDRFCPGQLEMFELNADNPCPRHPDTADDACPTCIGIAEAPYHMNRLR